jgi:hypothetical protein
MRDGLKVCQMRVKFEIIATFCHMLFLLTLCTCLSVVRHLMRRETLYFEKGNMLSIFRVTALDRARLLFSTWNWCFQKGLGKLQSRMSNSMRAINSVQIRMIEIIF